MIVGSACFRHHRPIILGASAEAACIARRGVEIVIHRDRQPLAPVLPSLPAIFAHIDAPIIAVIDTSGRRGRHEQGVMVRMRIFIFAGLQVPTGNFLPRSTSVGRAMQIDPATKNVVCIGRMNDDRVPVSHLFFVSEMRARNVFPAIATIIRPEDTEHILRFARRLEIENVGL